MKQFIANGYVMIKPNVPTSLHKTIYQKLDEVVAKEGNPGNNLLPRVPEIQEVFDNPVVHGAFTSVVGPNYIMHPHRHPHHNGPGSKGGGWLGGMERHEIIGAGGLWPSISHKTHQ